MNETVILQISIFILMGVGFLVKRLGLVGKEGQKNLTDLVIYVILPCNILTSFTADVSADILKDCAALFFISMGTQAACVILGKLLWKKEAEDKNKCLRYATICSNAGFLGNPIAESVYPETGLMYASVYLIPLRVMMWSEGIAIFSGEKDWKGTLKKVVTHPCVLACAAGIIIMIGKITLPALVAKPVSFLGRSNTALSMLVIGMILSDIRLRELVDRTVLKYTVLRLAGIPLAIFLICLALPVSREVRGICTLLAAMPAGATTSMLAAKYGRSPQFATKLVVFSTLCSIPAVMIWSMII